MITRPFEPSTVICSPSRTTIPPIEQTPAGLVDPQRVAAGDTGLAHAARDHRRVRGHAAVRGENALRRGEAVDVVRRRVEADEDHRLVLAALGRDVGVEDDGSDRSAR